MFDPSLTSEERARRYAIARGISLKQSLGFGKDGTIFLTEDGTAIKVFSHEMVFARERNCYERLLELNVFEVFGHNVPTLVNADEDLLVLEITAVQPPFILDFGSAYLDWPPDFPPEVLEEWAERKSEEFGPHWAKVQMILEFMGETYGIYLTDIHPGNISFGIEPKTPHGKPPS